MSEPDPSRPGSILRAEREALGVTVREVAETLNLSMTVIQAVEADDLDRLPGPVFARGYVRAYARLLELDPEPLLASYPEAPDPLPPLETSPEPPIWEWIRRRPGLVLGSGAGVLLAVLVALVIWLWPGGEGEDLQGGVTDAGQAEVVAPGDEAAAEEVTPSADAPPRPSALGGADAVELDDAGERPPAEGALSGQAAAAPSSDGHDVETVGAAQALRAIDSAREAAVGGGRENAVSLSGGADGARRITAAGNERLTFSFSDDCWVEVRDADGGNLYSDLNRAGSRLELVGEGPFRILLGYAPGVELAFNGEAVPLAPHTRNNVATVTLGQ